MCDWIGLGITEQAKATGKPMSSDKLVLGSIRSLPKLQAGWSPYPLGVS